MAGQAKHILVVDDNGDVRDVIVDTLQEHNYRVSAATDGSVMRDFLETGDTVDCVILDALMPGEASASLALHLKERGIPVVMISGSPDAMKYAMDNGLQLLRKPFRSQDLYSAVNTALASGEFGIGELYGISRNLTLPLAAATLLLIVLSGSYRRVERAAILIGSLELAFLLVAAMARPDFATVAHDVSDIPVGNNDSSFFGAALIGAVFNPLMVFYQQSATAEKQLGQRHYGAARGDTALGGVLTQLISASILFAAATTFGTGYQQTSLGSVGQISEALTPHLGATVGRLVFSLGVLGASMVAGIVCSLALAWALGEAAGYRRAPESQPFRAPWFYAVYAACELVGTALAWAIPNLIWLTIAAQIVDVFLLPMVLGFLLVLAASSLPDPNRLHGWYLGLVITAATATCGCAVLGAIHGILQVALPEYATNSRGAGFACRG